MKFKLYGIIVLICLVLGSLLFFNKEGFESNYSDYNKIDRIRNSSNKYAYCIAGQVTCPSNTFLSTLNDTYTKSNKGTTYEVLCHDKNGVTNHLAECSGNYVHKLSEKYRMSNQSLNSELDWKTPTARQINFQFSNEYKGFTTSYSDSHIPVAMNEDNIEFYDTDKNVLDSLHKCEMLNNQKETDECYFQIAKNKEVDAALKAAAIEDAKKKAIADAKANAEEDEPKKCVADFGTNLGDDLCCGQKGVLQYSAYKYICPESKPTCSNYICDEQYGTCS
jgi:hypothetical protein